jgi:hypothetical protein
MENCILNAKLMADLEEYKKKSEKKLPSKCLFVVCSQKWHLFIGREKRCMKYVSQRRGPRCTFSTAHLLKG